MASGKRPRRPPDGPLPTAADMRAMGVTRVRLHCYEINRHGVPCHHTGAMDLAALGVPPETPFVHVGRRARLRCSRCGGRAVSVLPDWPLVRGQMAPAEGVREVRNGVVVEG